MTLRHLLSEFSVDSLRSQEPESTGKEFFEDIPLGCLVLCEVVL